MLVTASPHSLELSCVSIFSSFIASAILPLILNFPDMKARVGFSLPKKKTQNHQKKKKELETACAQENVMPLQRDLAALSLPSSAVKAVPT